MRLLHATTVFTLLTLLAPSILAQDNPPGNNAPNNPPGNNAPNNLPDLSAPGDRTSAAPASSAAPSKTDAAATTDAKSDAAATTEASKTDDAKTDDASKTDSPSAAATTAAPTNSDTAKASITNAESLPQMTTAAPTYKGITDAPTLSDFYSYPPPTVPPTAMAPFMQRSSLPQGTVFIVAAAVLGAGFLGVLLWRAWVAWQLRRNLRRGSANNPFSRLSPKGLLGGGTGDSAVGGMGRSGKPFYTQVPGSAMSLNVLSGDAKHGYSPGAANGSGSLFFSPTAAVTGAHHHQSAASTATLTNHAGHRGSSYLPAGYYAAGASAVGGGVAASGRPVSMADHTDPSPRRHSPGPGAGLARGAGAAHSPSPLHQAGDAGGGPPSPSWTNASTAALHPRHTPELPYGRASTGARLSTVSLTRSEGRAPSAYLEDLFDVPPMPER